MKTISVVGIFCRHSHEKKNRVASQPPGTPRTQGTTSECGPHRGIRSIALPNDDPHHDPIWQLLFCFDYRNIRRTSCTQLVSKIFRPQNIKKIHPKRVSGTMGAESGVSFYLGSEVFSFIGCNRTIFRPIFDRGKKLCARRSAGPQQKRNGHVLSEGIASL